MSTTKKKCCGKCKPITLGLASLVKSKPTSLELLVCLGFIITALAVLLLNV